MKRKTNCPNTVSTLEQHIINCSLDGIVIFDERGIISVWNNAMEAITGFDGADILGRYFYDIQLQLTPQNHRSDYRFEKLKQQMRAIVENEDQSWSGTLKENEIQRADGQLRTTEANFFPIETENGLKICSIHRDITQRKQAEKKLIESENRYRHLFNHMNNGVAVLKKTNDDQFVFVDFNRAAQKIEKVNREDVIGKNLVDTFPAVKKFKLLNAIEAVSKSGRPQQFPITLIKNDRIISWRENYISRLPSGEITVVYDDITKRKRVEQALKESEAKYRRFTQNVPDMIFRVSLPNGDFEYVNPASEEIMGYSPQELMANSQIMFDSVHEDWREYFEEQWRKLFYGQLMSTYEYRIADKKGRSKWLRQRSVLVLDEQKKPVAIEGIIQNITEDKMLQDQVRQSEKMEAIGQLAGGIAHDFNNQLAGIMGYADLLHDDVKNNPFLADYAENILKGVRKAADLTSKLLAFARKGKYQSVNVDMHRIVFEVVNLLSHSIKKKIRIRQELGADPSTVMGDPTQLENAILNLGLNARDAMPQGGELFFKTDTVELDQQYCDSMPYAIKPGIYFEVSVSDTGCGMDNWTQKRVFEPFFTTKEQGKGTGMGLAAVYGTIKGHKGSITVDSTLGKGTCFKIYLPVATGHATDPFKAVSHKKARPTGKGHVLLVDDENMIRSVGTRMLKRLGYKITTCKNGEEACRLYKKEWETFDVVILDMVMPIMDGKETFQVMRNINPNIQSLLASGFSIDGEAQSILDEGVKGFIQKPFGIEDLSDKLSEIMSVKPNRK